MSVPELCQFFMVLGKKEEKKKKNLDKEESVSLKLEK